MTARELRAKQRKILREKYRLEGVCITCGRPRAYEGVLQCSNCLSIQHRTRDKKYNRNKKLGLCVKCGEPAVPSRINCKECALREINYRHTTKQEVIDHYGGKCIECGDTRLAVLQLDHVNNDGRKHRKEIDGNSQYRTGQKLYKLLIKLNYNINYQLQVMYANCHALKHWGSYDKLKATV